MALKKVTLNINKEALAKIPEELILQLTKAADEMGNIFLKQSYRKNEELLSQIKDEAIKKKILQNAGPFDRTNHNKPFIEGHNKPLGAGFYPEDMTKETWNSYITQHPTEKKALENPYTIIKKEGEKLITIPYKEAFKQELTKAANHLRQASILTQNHSLQQFLQARATALLTDTYYKSELLWMDLNSKIEVTIGPYEVYEDEINGYKTAYEAFIGLVDTKATQEVKHLEEQATLLETHIPLADQHKNMHRGKSSPIKIVEEIYSAGDCKSGIHFTAFNLPNDEKVREAKGSKKVMIKNVAQAKYEHCWKPIVSELFTEHSIQLLGGFDAYFLHILLHEISHGLGPGKITVNGQQNTVSSFLKETYPTIEEAKADILGVHNGFILAEKNVITKKQSWEVLHSFIAGIFRSIRFGITEAHGGANSIALNYLLEQQAASWEEGKLEIDQEKAKKTLQELLEKILVIQAYGNYEAAKILIETYRPHREETKKIIERLADIPIDINPRGPLE